MRAPFLAALLSASALSAPACAPRNTRTHFDRWTQETALRKAEEELDAKAREWVREQVAKVESPKEPTPAVRDVASEPAALPSRKPATRAGGGSSPLFETPEIRTSTRSRAVVRPTDTGPEESTDEEDDEPIY